MTDADVILQGLFIGSLSFGALIAVYICLKKRAKKFHIKKSASTEELSSVDTTEPTQTQDEERYAWPPVLVTTISQHKV
jgi:hypothetical protein